MLLAVHDEWGISNRLVERYTNKSKSTLILKTDATNKELHEKMWIINNLSIIWSDCFITIEQ